MRSILDSREWGATVIDAVGSDFPAEDEGCNGTFPQLVIYGGKMPVQ